MENVTNTIEQEFLNNSQVKTFFKLGKINTLQGRVGNAQKKKFGYNVELSVLVLEAYEQITSEQGKQLMEQNDIHWTREEFYLKAFGWKKAYFGKVKKMGMNQVSFPDSVQAYYDAVEEYEQSGLKASLSVVGYNYFCDNEMTLKEIHDAQASEESDAIDNEESDGEESETDEVLLNSNTDVSITIKLGEQTICLRRTDGQLISHNASGDIVNALQDVIDMVNTQGVVSASDAS